MGDVRRCGEMWGAALLQLTLGLRGGERLGELFVLEHLVRVRGRVRGRVRVRVRVRVKVRVG